jgi:hypothetical protein
MELWFGRKGSWLIPGTIQEFTWWDWVKPLVFRPNYNISPPSLEPRVLILQHSILSIDYLSVGVTVCWWREFGYVSDGQCIESIYTWPLFQFMNNTRQLLCVVSDLLIMTYILPTSITHWSVIRQHCLEDISVVLSRYSICFDNISSSS